MLVDGEFQSSNVMPHAKSLRAIGQSLESLGVVAFVMKKNGRNYVVSSDSLPDIATLSLKKSLSEKVWDSPGSSRRAGQLIERDHALHYVPSYVAWLDAQGRRKRRKRLSAQVTGTMKVSQFLRTLGKHLDRLEPHAFTITWSRERVCIDYELGDGQQLSEMLTMEKLRQLTLRMRFRRSPRC
jgi:hypothetical protein